ncbi:MAG TPA: hypothetical protein VF463_10505 [Sphingobium sp.]
MSALVEKFEDFADDAAAFLGEKVIEMADRLAVVNKVTPGSQATYSFECDGVVFKIVMTVAGKPGQ